MVRISVGNGLLACECRISQYREREEGVVYPGDVEVVVQVNGSTICSEVTDTSCTVDLSRDVYNISITQSNDIGSTVDSSIFDSEFNSNQVT